MSATTKESATNNTAVVGLFCVAFLPSKGAAMIRTVGDAIDEATPAGLRSLVTDFEVSAAATIDPEAAAVEAPCATLDAGRAADLASQADVAAGANVTPVSLAIVGGAGDDAGWWRLRLASTADDELGAAAPVDPEAAPVYAPGIALDAGRSADLADEASIAATADVAVVSFAIVGGADNLRLGAISLAVPLLRGCG
jgi:hypothetical protein